MTIAIAMTAFIALNWYLLFSDKSTIQKTVYVDQYEIMSPRNYTEKMAKEALIAPLETHTIYVDEEETIDTWLVKEGDQVNIGNEIALLQTERSDRQRAVWQSELTALQQQRSAMNSLITELESERKKAKSNSTSNVDKKDAISKKTEEIIVDLGMNIDVKVDVTQEGSFAQAIAATEQQLVDIERKIVVLEAQLAQNPATPALVSPVEGFVSEVTKRGATLAVDIASSQQVVVTYAKGKEWQRLESGDTVVLQGEGLTEAIRGTILSISRVPASPSTWLDAYKQLDPQPTTNPLEYYEVRIMMDTQQQHVPFGANVNAMIITDEAQQALAVKEKWLTSINRPEATVAIIDNQGRAQFVTITTPFSTKSRAVVTEGLRIGGVVVHEPQLEDYDYAPSVFLPLPTDLPPKAEWKAFGWKRYAKYMFLQ